MPPSAPPPSGVIASALIGWRVNEDPPTGPIAANARADPDPLWQEFAGSIEAVEISPPDQVFDDAVTLDVGNRSVVLAYHGLGHTDGDVVVAVPGAGVLFAGDLVEEGAPPQFHDGYPLD